MPATKVVIETRADGAGVPVAAQSLVPNQTLVVYSITRDALDVFVANAAATWSLINKTGSVVNGDLVAAGDNKSATFTADENGTAIIQAVTVDPFTGTSGIISVIDALVLLSDVKLYLGKSNSDADSLLAGWLILVTAQIEAELNQPVISRPTLDILNGSGQSVQYLDSGRIVSLVGTDETARLANLQYRDSPTDAWVDLMDDEANISIDDENLLRIERLDGGIFPVGRKNIRVYYNCGFTGRALSDLQKLCIEKIQMMWDESKQGADLLNKISKTSSQAGGNRTLSLKSEMPQWEAVINRYRRHPVG